MSKINPLPLEVAEPIKVVAHICNVGQSVYGAEYLHQMLARATAFFGFPYALVGRPDPLNPRSIRSEILLANGELQEGIVYELAGAPCENVLDGNKVCFYGQNVNKLFPDDLLLEEMGVVSYMGAPLLSPENELLGILAFMGDSPVEITEEFASVFEFIAMRCGMELTRDDLNLKLVEKREVVFREKRLASLGQLATGVAHDFNNLLSGLLGHAELLELKMDSEHAGYTHVQGILKSLQRSKNITQPLLDFVRPQAKRGESVVVNHVITELFNLLQPSFDHAISFEVNFESADLVADIDGTHLQQILLNLALNAQDAMPSGGKLEINACLTTDMPLDVSTGLMGAEFITIEIRDSGVGIGADSLDKIFDPFYTTKDVNKGSGLGLASVHSLVQTYNGAISVQSTIDKGSTFTLYIPRSLNPVESTIRSEFQVGARGKNLLLAEDDETIAFAMSEYLSLKGYSVTLVRDGQEALNLVNQHNQTPAQFDLLLTDLKMPKLDGKQLLDQVLAIEPDMKVIVSTGDPSRIDIDGLTESKSCTLLVKPFRFSQLHETICEMLDNHIQ